jgi:ATP-dependent Clp protease ATP-binding subunit ClpA
MLKKTPALEQAVKEAMEHAVEIKSAFTDAQHLFSGALKQRDAILIHFHKALGSKADQIIASLQKMVGVPLAQGQKVDKDSPQMSRIVDYATQIAQSAGDAKVGIYHLLMALIADPYNSVNKFMTGQGVDMTDLQTSLTDHKGALIVSADVSSAIVNAQQVAVEMESDILDTGHLLIGVVNSKSDDAGLMRTTFGWDPKTLDAVARKLLNKEPFPKEWKNEDVSPSVKEAINKGKEIASSKGDDHFRLPHLLWGIMSVSGGTGSKALKGYGINLEKIEEIL